MDRHAFPLGRVRRKRLCLPHNNDYTHCFVAGDRVSSRCSSDSIVSDNALKACGRLRVNLTTPRASWVRKTTGSLASVVFGVRRFGYTGEAFTAVTVKPLLLKFQIGNSKNLVSVYCERQHHHVV